MEQEKYKQYILLLGVHYIVDSAMIEANCSHEEFYIYLEVEQSHFLKKTHTAIFKANLTTVS